MMHTRVLGKQVVDDAGDDGAEANGVDVEGDEVADVDAVDVDIFVFFFFWRCVGR